MGDWTIDRKIFGFFTKTGDTPIAYLRGQLLESWEAPDNLTVICHVRKGIRFQDKPPVNGREFTADDLVWNLQRIIKSPFTDKRGIEYVQSLTTLDKWTVEIKLKPPPVVDVVRPILDHNDSSCIAKESVGKSGEIEDWRNIVGTGPFVMEDFVRTSSVTFKKNPNYWAYDELHSKNRLPYADMVKILIIPDIVTQEAALRTGRVDQVMEIGWQVADNLKKTNPQLLFNTTPQANPTVFRPRVDKKPFDDVRVRQALSMAMDRLEIAATFYGGYATPYKGAID